jgi:hypothetical protein
MTGREPLVDQSVGQLGTLPSAELLSYVLDTDKLVFQPRLFFSARCAANDWQLSVDGN